MATSRDPARSQFPPPPSDVHSRPLRVDPFAPLPTSSPLAQPIGESASWPEEVQMNSVSATVPAARTTSRKRRISGTGGGNRKSQFENNMQPPAAPEVPRAPPVSYRGSYTSNGTSPTIGNPTSFAARARGFAEEQDMITAGLSPEAETIAQPTSQSRRKSIDRHSQAAKPDLLNKRQEPATLQPATTIDGLPIQQSTAAKALQKREVADAMDTQASANASGPYINSAPVPARSGTRRSSAGAADPLKEWAPDRSPLQKLEVKLNDISKEEKRARVEKAERKLRERQAEEERRKKEQNLQTNASFKEIGEGPGGTKNETRAPPQEVMPDPDPDSRRNKRQSRNRPTAPTYVEDIDQQQLERQQQPSSQKATVVSARSLPQGKLQRPVKTASSELASQQQTGRGVRFQRGSSSEEEMNDFVSRNEQNSEVPQDTHTVSGHNNGPQQKLRQQELARGASHSKEVPGQQQTLYSSKAQRSGETDDPAAYGGAPDPVPKSSVRTQNHAIEYEVPPQTAAGIEARQKVGFGGDPAGALPAPAQHHRNRLSKILHHGHANVPTQAPAFETQPRHLDEWRQGGTAHLTAADLVNDLDGANDQKAWWERNKSGSQRGKGAKLPAQAIDQTSVDGGFPKGYGMYACSLLKSFARFSSFSANHP